jgi:hypothetical protein
MSGKGVNVSFGGDFLGKKNYASSENHSPHAMTLLLFAHYFQRQRQN